MQLDKFMIGLVVFLVLFTAGTMLIVDVNLNYEDIGVNMSIDKYIDDLTPIANNGTTLNSSEDMHNFILDDKVNEDEVELSMFKGAYSAIRAIPTSLTIVNNIMHDLASVLGIPKAFVQFGFTALIISILFTIAYIVFRISKNT